jgi:hypothetical protein
MRHFSIALGSCAALIATIALSSAPLDAQAGQTSAASKTWTPPRTADGHPDLQGTYDFATATPLERPASLAGKAVLTDAEAAAYEKQQRENRKRIDDAPLPPGQVGGYNEFWYEFGTKVVGDRRTSLITDPPDGRLPPLLPGAQQRADERRARLRRLADGPEDRDASERCLLGYNSGPPMIPVGYNQNVQIVQTHDYVMVHNEMVHTARVIPVDGRPHHPPQFLSWSGDSRGHWERDTLVVETTNFNDQTWNQFSGWSWAVDENLQLVERFSLIDAETVLYEFTVTDPTTWTKPWTAAVPLRRTTNLMYEYACHEGNEGMEGILRGARALERDAQAGTKPSGR